MRYKIPQNLLYNDYFRLVKKLNPDLKDINVLQPGQLLRMPMPSRVKMKYSSEKHNLFEPKVTPKKSTSAHGSKILAKDLGKIFLDIGEEWINSGEHYIPFKSGGHVQLSAASFPILYLRNGLVVIIDLEDRLPVSIEKAIRANWRNYRVVHLRKNDDIKSALEKIFEVCGYQEIRKAGEPLRLPGYVELDISGDWILSPSGGLRGEKEKYVVIHLVSDNGSKTPSNIKRYLMRRGIKVVDFPAAETAPILETRDIKPIILGTNPLSLIEKLLKGMGFSFSSQTEIPVYQSHNGIRVVIKADVLLKVEQKDAIIDVSGLSPGIVSLLNEHRFRYLSLAGIDDPMEIVVKILDFLHIPFASGVHHFLITGGDNRERISIGIPGVTFSKSKLTKMIVISHELPREVNMILSRKNYRIFVLNTYSQPLTRNN